MELVLDCSITAAWCFEDEKNSYSEEALDALRNYTGWVPCIWPLEISNVLLVAERKKRITRIKAESFKQALNKLPIHIDHSHNDHIINSIYEIARETHLSAYDAAYLELAYRKKIPIYSFDKAILKSAKNLNVATKI